jgi:hypothetical protein
MTLSYFAGGAGRFEARRHRLEPIRRCVMPHRLRVIAEIVEGLAQAELKASPQRHISR